MMLPTTASTRLIIFFKQLYVLVHFTGFGWCVSTWPALSPIWLNSLRIVLILLILHLLHLAAPILRFPVVDSVPCCCPPNGVDVDVMPRHLSKSHSLGLFLAFVISGCCFCFFGIFFFFFFFFCFVLMKCIIVWGWSISCTFRVSRTKRVAAWKAQHGRVVSAVLIKWLRKIALGVFWRIPDYNSNANKYFF